MNLFFTENKIFKNVFVAVGIITKFHYIILAKKVTVSKFLSTACTNLIDMDYISKEIVYRVSTILRKDCRGINL